MILCEGQRTLSNVTTWWVFLRIHRLRDRHPASKSKPHFDDAAPLPCPGDKQEKVRVFA